MKNLSWPSLRIMWISSALFLALAFSLITLQPIAATADQQAIPPKAKDILLAANNACLQLKTATYDFEGDRFNGSQSIVNNKYHVIQSWGAVPNKRADGKYLRWELILLQVVPRGPLLCRMTDQPFDILIM